MAFNFVAFTSQQLLHAGRNLCCVTSDFIFSCRCLLASTGAVLTGGFGLC